MDKSRRDAQPYKNNVIMFSLGTARLRGQVVADGETPSPGTPGAISYHGPLYGVVFIPARGVFRVSGRPLP